MNLDLISQIGLREYLKRVERRAILFALTQGHWNLKSAAKLLRTHQQRVKNRMKYFGIEKGDTHGKYEDENKNQEVHTKNEVK